MNAEQTANWAIVTRHQSGFGRGVFPDRTPIRSLSHSLKQPQAPPCSVVGCTWSSASRPYTSIKFSTSQQKQVASQFNPAVLQCPSRKTFRSSSITLSPSVKPILHVYDCPVRGLARGLAHYASCRATPNGLV